MHVWGDCVCLDVYLCVHCACCGGIVHARMYAGVFVFMSVCVQYACLCMGSMHV